MPTVLIAGGTGTIGKRLNERLVQKGYKVIILTRHISSQKNGAGSTSYARWNIEKGEIDEQAIAQSDYIINLAGAGVVESRWTDERKRVITESRTSTCALLVKALHQVPNQVKAVISSSASGYYGPDTPDATGKGFTEEDKASADFLGQVCRQWEDSIAPVKALGKRLVILRTGIVLSREGGAFREFVKPFRFGMAAILGNGRQIVSWVHEDDICGMYIHALEQESMSGAYNAVAPAAVSNKALVLSIAKARHKFYIPMHVPAFVLRIMMGEMSFAVLRSQHLSAARIQQAGYTFLFPEIDNAVKDLL